MDVRVRFGTGRAGAREILLVELVGAVRPAAGKRRERAERVRAAEEPGEVVQDVVELEVESALELVLCRCSQVTVSATCQRLIVVSRGLKLLRPMVSTVVPDSAGRRLRGWRCWRAPAPCRAPTGTCTSLKTRRAEDAGPAAR